MYASSILRCSVSEGTASSLSLHWARQSRIVALAEYRFDQRNAIEEDAQSKFRMARQRPRWTYGSISSPPHTAMGLTPACPVTGHRARSIRQSLAALSYNRRAEVFRSLIRA